LVADDSEQTIHDVSILLAKEFEVVGFTRDGAETILAVIRLQPDVVVMDILLPKPDGIQVVRRLKQMNSPTKAVFLSGLEGPEYVKASLAAGASGFVFKNRAATDLCLAIREALVCKVFVSAPSGT
jgi:DNA-binding NarL/FixJ family response regulator